MANVSKSRRQFSWVESDSDAWSNPRPAARTNPGTSALLGAMAFGLQMRQRGRERLIWW